MNHDDIRKEFTRTHVGTFGERGQHYDVSAMVGEIARLRGIVARVEATAQRYEKMEDKWLLRSAVVAADIRRALRGDA